MPTDTARRHAERAYAHIHHFAEVIGPRPSTRAGERQAAEYFAQVLQAAGLPARLEAFESGRSTYRPFALAFATGLLGVVVYQLMPTGWAAALALALNALGAWAFFREAELSEHWGRRLLPRGASQNAIGVAAPHGERRRRVVVYGHLDTHRTPIFYSHPLWLRAFSTLVGACFLGLAVNALNFAWAWASGGPPVGVLTGLTVGFQVFGLVMCLHADLTPFSPGANDNASGAASALALGERLAREPLPHTEVWIVGNGCEELGAYGIRALLAAHAEALRDADLIALDMVGIGAPTLLTREGLLLSSYPDARLLALARQVSAAHPGLLGPEHTGGAYTDTGLVSRRGFRGLTVDTQIPAGHPAAARMGHWHQLSDRLANIDPECLARTHAFVWALLAALDAQAPASG